MGGDQGGNGCQTFKAKFGTKLRFGGCQHVPCIVDQESVSVYPNQMILSRNLGDAFGCGIGFQPVVAATQASSLLLPHDGYRDRYEWRLGDIQHARLPGGAWEMPPGTEPCTGGFCDRSGNGIATEDTEINEVRGR